MTVRITVASKLGPCVSPAAVGPCVFPGGVNISPGDGAPGVAMSPARAEPDSTHASAIANARRFILFISPLRVESYKPFCGEYVRIATFRWHTK